MPRQTEISVEGEKRLDDLNKALLDHCNSNDKNFDELRALLPLAELIEPIQKIVKNQEANSIVAAKLVRLIGVIGATAAAFYGVWQLLKEFIGR